MAHGRHWPGDVQLEYCEFCGVRLPAAKRIQATTQEYAGRWACPKCAPLVLNPSYLDYGGPGNIAPTPGEIEPHSGVDWITEIQGETTYTSFYAGAAPGLSPDEQYNLTNQQIYGLPFSVPRRAFSNRLSTVSLTCTSSTLTSYRLALYRQTGALVNPGRRLADLGTMSLAPGVTTTVDVGLYLPGDAVYFLTYSLLAPIGGLGGTVEGLTYVNTNGILGGNYTVLRSPGSSWWVPASASAWPIDGGPIPWRKWPFDFPAFKLTLGD